MASTPVVESWDLKILRFCHWEDNLEIYFKSHKKLIFFNLGITVVEVCPKDVFQKHERAICITKVHPTGFCKREWKTGRGKEGERGREEKGRREEERTAFVYCLHRVCLIPLGSEMANSFLRVYQGNWMQNQPRPQK